MKWVLTIATVLLAALGVYWFVMPSSSRNPEHERVVAIIRPLGGDGPPPWKTQHIEPMQLTAPSMKEDAVPYADTFVGNLTIRYALDGDETMINISPAIAGKLGIGREELLPLATKNLHQRYPDAKIERGNGLSMVTGGGDLESSWMLDFEFWKEEAQRVSGTLVLAVPARDTLAWTDSQNEAAMATMKRLTAQVFAAQQAENRELSPVLFAWKNDHWEVY